jgi:REP element-mobilizing transposase RayT
VARPLRIAFPGGLYHLIARGNAREDVYRDTRDHELFLEVVGHVVERFGWLCYAYCLMDNHYHLVLETPRPNLSSGMRQLIGLYARRFNLRHDRCGHVFQSRFRSILVENGSHLLEACRYVVLNPVRAGIYAQPDEWRWSSYRACAGTGPTEPFLSVDALLGHFGETERAARDGYRRFVADGLAEATEDAVRGERLGGEAFLRERLRYDPPLPEVPRVQVEPLRRSLEGIFAQEERPVAAAYREHGYTLREIGEFLGCHYSTVSRRLLREEADPPSVAMQDLTPERRERRRFQRLPQ